MADSQSIATAFLGRYTETAYKRERAILAAYDKWAAQYIQPNGWTVIPAGKKPRGKASLADNAMRSRVERFELFSKAPPERYSAYIGDDGLLTTWTGDPIGTYRATSTWRTPNSYISSTMSQYRCYIDGVAYTGRCGGKGLLINLRLAA